MYTYCVYMFTYRYMYALHLGIPGVCPMLGSLQSRQCSAIPRLSSAVTHGIMYLEPFLPVAPE